MGCTPLATGLHLGSSCAALLCAISNTFCILYLPTPGNDDTDGPGKPKPKFAIITANGTEQNVVKRYLKLGDYGRVWEQLSAYECEKDPFLKKKEVKIIAKDPVDSYDMFTIGEVEGVHVKCTRYGPGGAQDTISDLLKKASEEKWPLKVLFVVGCCGVSMSDAKKTQKNWRGTVLLSEQMEDYLDAGKAEDVRFLQNTRTYTLGGTWVSRLSEESICQPDVVEESQRDIPVEVVSKYLSGSLVIKTADLANRCRGELCQMAGIEMEGSGVYNTVDRSTLKDTTKVAVVKGISDYAGSDKDKKAKSVVFGKETAEEIDDKARQEIATLHAITLVTRCVASNAKRF